MTGLARVPNGINGEGPSVEFEQYERHTAWDRPGGIANRSGAGDLDVVVYSARRWCRLALAGQPPLTYVTTWRMSAAAQLLRQTDTSIAAIASRTGYSTEFAFAKAFKRHYGVAPGAYRRENRAA